MSLLIRELVEDMGEVMKKKLFNVSLNQIDGWRCDIEELNGKYMRLFSTERGAKEYKEYLEGRLDWGGLEVIISELIVNDTYPKLDGDFFKEDIEKGKRRIGRSILEK